MATVTFRDETATGRPLEEFALPDLPDSISARELVRLRVREEVARYNAAPTATYNGLVRPVDAEVELNGYRMGARRWIDWERQAVTAPVRARVETRSERCADIRPNDRPSGGQGRRPTQPN